MQEFCTQMLKPAFYVLGAVFTISAALFGFLNTLHGERQERVKEWFRARWEALRKSRWRNLSERSIERVLDTSRWANELLRDVITSKKGRAFFYSLVVAWVALCFTSLAFRTSNHLFRYLLLAIQVPCYLFLLARGSDKEGSGLHDFFAECRRRFRHTINWMDEQFPILQRGDAEQHFMVLALFLLPLGACAPYFLVIVNLYIAAAASIALIPVYWIAAWAVATFSVTVAAGRPVKWVNSGRFGMSMFAIGISFSVTLLAFVAGHAVSPDAWVPRTVRMLTSNVLCDGVTMFATLTILAWAIKKRSFLRIPFAIIVDIAVAAVLACASLYLGLVGTDHALTRSEVFNVLIGRAPSGGGTEFGPYFWAMHTTFIPTGLYLSFIAVAWLGKAMLQPVGWFLGQGHEHKSPLKLTAALFALLAVIFGVLATLFGALWPVVEATVGGG